MRAFFLRWFLEILKERTARGMDTVRDLKRRIREGATGGEGDWREGDKQRDRETGRERLEVELFS